jgi:Transport and Golgi organisation 2
MDKGPSFASLRDESPLRPKALLPEIYNNDGVRYIAPIDAQAGGTWVGLNEYGNVIILLNGAFEKHIRQSYYRQSRGLIVKSLLSHSMPVIEWNLMDLLDIEPFTLVVWTDNNLFQLVWDGDKKHRLRLDASQPHIWSSATLYDPSASTHRTNLFQEWMSINPQIDIDTMRDFFYQYTDPYNGYIMDRNGKVQTISYTFIDVNKYDTPSLYYSDMQDVSVSCTLHESMSDTGKSAKL